MSLDLKEFIEIDWFKRTSTLADNLGIPLSNRFAMLLNAPKSPAFQKNGWLEIQVLSADCPDLSLEMGSQELNGTQRYFAKGRSDGDLQVTFLETPDLSLRRFFFAWMSVALKVDKDGSTRRGYLEEYVASELKIAPLDFEGKAHYADRFIDAFPYKIADINYNYGASNEMIKTVVYFKYRVHDVVGMDNDDNYHFIAKGQDTRKEWAGYTPRGQTKG